MKGKRLAKVLVCGLTVVALLSTVAVGCTQEQQPTGPTTTISPIVPTQTTGPTTTVQPTTPGQTSTPTAPAAEVINWKFQTHENPELINSTLLTEYLAPTLEEMSDGRLTMDVFYAAQLVPNEELVDAAVNGVVDAFDISQGYFSGNMPWTFTAGMEPFFAPNGTEIFEWTYDWEGGKVFDWQQEQWSEFGIRFMTHVPANGISVIGTKPITNLGNVSDLIIRTHSASAMFWEALGARTVYIPGPEIYTGLQLGTADYASWKQAGSFRDFNWDEVAKYIIQPAYGPYAAHQNYVALRAWDNLSPDLQAIADSAFRWMSYQHYWKYVTYDQQALQLMMEENDVQVVDISGPEDQARVAAAWAEVLDEIASRSESAQEYIDLINEYNRWKGYID